MRKFLDYCNKENFEARYLHLFNFEEHKEGIFSILIDDEKFGILELIFSCKSSYSSKLMDYHNFRKQLIIVRDLNGNYCSKNCFHGYGQCAGFRTFFKKSYHNDYSINLNVREMLDFNKIYRKQLFTSQDIENFDPKFKYNNYKNNSYIDVFDYLNLFLKYPQLCETFMKLNLFRFINEKNFDTLTKNKLLLNYIYKNASVISENNYSFTWVKNALKKNDTVEHYCISLKFRINISRELSKIKKELYEKIVTYTSREKLQSYLEKNAIKPDIYNDYIIACDFLGNNFSDTKILFPKKFKEMHDYKINQMLNLKEIISDEQQKEHNKIIVKLKKEYSDIVFEDEDFKVVLPSKYFDFQKESEKLGHCLFASGYIQKYINKDDIICFIRNKNDIDEPFVTCEINFKDFKIGQFYGYENKIIENTIEFKNNFQQHLNKIKKNLSKECLT